MKKAKMNIKTGKLGVQKLVVCEDEERGTYDMFGHTTFELINPEKSNSHNISLAALILEPNKGSKEHS